MGPLRFVAVMGCAATIGMSAAGSAGAAEAGSTECDRLTAAPYHAGAAGVAYKDIESGKAVFACEAALTASPGDPRIWMQLGRALQKGGRAARAAAAYRKAADGGDPVAQHNLALMLASGWDGVPANAAASFREHLKAAESGFVPSMPIVAAAYRDGKGTTADPTAAETWTKAAAAGVQGSAKTAAEQPAALPAVGTPPQKTFDVGKIAKVLDGAPEKTPAQAGAGQDRRPPVESLRHWANAGDPGSALEIARSLMGAKDGGSEALMRAYQAYDLARGAPLDDPRSWLPLQREAARAVIDAVAAGAAPRDAAELATLKSHFGGGEAVLVSNLSCRKVERTVDLTVWDWPRDRHVVTAQLDHLEKVRGCFVDPELRRSFDRVFDIAKSNRSSFTALTSTGLAGATPKKAELAEPPGANPDLGKADVLKQLRETASGCLGLSVAGGSSVAAFQLVLRLDPNGFLTAAVFDPRTTKLDLDGQQAMAKKIVACAPFRFPRNSYVLWRISHIRWDPPADTVEKERRSDPQAHDGDAAPGQNHALSGGGSVSPPGGSQSASPDADISGKPAKKLSASERAGIDNAVREQVTQCWNPPIGGSTGDDLAVRVIFTLNADGTLLDAPKVVNSSSNPAFRAAAGAATRAVQRCAPLKLPTEAYDYWRQVSLVFDAREFDGSGASGTADKQQPSGTGGAASEKQLGPDSPGQVDPSRYDWQGQVIPEGGGASPGPARSSANGATTFGSAAAEKADPSKPTTDQPSGPGTDATNMRFWRFDDRSGEVDPSEKDWERQVSEQTGGGKREEAAPLPATKPEAAKLTEDEIRKRNEAVRALKAGEDAPAFELILSLAKKGDATSQYYVGFMEKIGRNGTVHLPSVLRWYNRSAIRGDQNAQFALGHMYWVGEGVKKDPVQAHAWWLKAAQQGNASAQFQVGKIYEIGQGAEKNLAEARRWYIKSADGGLADAQREIAKSFDFGAGVAVDIDQAIAWYDRAAKQNDVDSVKGLARIRELESLGRQNLSEASEFYRRAGLSADADRVRQVTAAADAGPAEQVRIAKLYRSGAISRARDEAEAILWLQKAAAQGSAEAEVEVASAHLYGSSLRKDFAIGAEFLRKAADQGRLDAQLWLAALYEKGKGVPADPAAAASWLSRAADQGSAAAQYRLAAFYSKGIGVRKDAVRFVALLRSSADQGYLDAQVDLGRALFKGDGVKEDSEAAIPYLRAGAAAGRVNSLHLLGVAYLTGDGLPRDMPLAYENLVKVLNWLSADVTLQIASVLAEGDSKKRYLGKALSLIEKKRSDLDEDYCEGDCDDKDFKKLRSRAVQLKALIQRFGEEPAVASKAARPSGQKARRESSRQQAAPRSGSSGVRVPSYSYDDEDDY